MQHYVYVLAKDGTPLMPTKRYGRVRRLLKGGLAKAKYTKPFTIQLLYEIDDPKMQTVYVSEDPGRTNIGVAAVREDGKCLFRAKCETRNKDIPKLMGHRKANRQARRKGEREARKRLAKHNNTTMAKDLERKLPGYQHGTVTVNGIINTEARFNNRKRSKGFLTPTARQLLQTHENLAAFVAKILPVKGFIGEINRFDFQRMENPKIYRWQYQRGPLYGKVSVEDAVKDAQKGKCLLCGKAGIEHVHHMIPRSKGGSDTIANLAGLCLECHEKIHHDDEALKKLSKKKTGFNKKYGALSVLNQVITRLFHDMADQYEEVYCTRGWDTKRYREEHGLSKDHDIDAYAIAMTVIDKRTDTDMPPCYEIKQFRNHDRAKIKAQVFRSYYLGTEKVAKNRHRATTAKVAEDGTIKESEQDYDSLEEWFCKMAETYGHDTAQTLRSKLRVVPSYRRYNNKDRIMPGAVFYHKGKRYIMTGQLTNGNYLRAYGQEKCNFPTKECNVYPKAGLVTIY